LHRRLVDICADAEVGLHDLAGLSIVPLAGADAILAAPRAKSNILQPTPLFGAVDAHIGEHRPRLIVFDTLADMFAGEENQRAQARQFVGLLRGLCIRHETTALMLAHPSLSGMASGSGSSGSTAWNNSVRSRLYLERVKGDDGTEPDPDLRTLTTKKANYGRTGQQIRLVWRRGVFRVAASSESSFSAIAAQSKAERVFLGLLRAYEDEGRHVSATPSANFAPAIFAKDDTRAEGITKRGFTDAMNRLFERGDIRVEEFGKPSRRLRRIVLVDREPQE
jgi:RecA-family ATPase